MPAGAAVPAVVVIESVAIIRCQRLEESVNESLPPCRACGSGDLVPLSDFGGQGAAVHFKAWVCTNPACGYNLKIRNGEIIRNEPVSEAEGRAR
jgi:hypothetical protein